MIRFKDYKNLTFNELFKGFYILKEDEIDKLIKNLGCDRLIVSGGLLIIAYPKEGTLKLIDSEIKSGLLGYPSKRYFQNSHLYTLPERFEINVWFTSDYLAEKFIAKFGDNKRININISNDSMLNQSLYIISDKKQL